MLKIKLNALREQLNVRWRYTPFSHNTYTFTFKIQFNVYQMVQRFRWFHSQTKELSISFERFVASPHIECKFSVDLKTQSIYENQFEIGWPL